MFGFWRQEKDAMSALNKYIQDAYQVNVTALAIIDAMHADEVPVGISSLIDMLSEFSQSSPAS
jgi:hypothetical protein